VRAAAGAERGWQLLRGGKPPLTRFDPVRREARRARLRLLAGSDTPGDDPTTVAATAATIDRDTPPGPASVARPVSRRR
jgi:hypothetical protein